MAQVRPPLQSGRVVSYNLFYLLDTVSALKLSPTHS